MLDRWWKEETNASTTIKLNVLFASPFIDIRIINKQKKLLAVRSLM